MSEAALPPSNSKADLAPSIRLRRCAACRQALICDLRSGPSIFPICDNADRWVDASRLDGPRVGVAPGTPHPPRRPCMCEDIVVRSPRHEDLKLPRLAGA